MSITFFDNESSYKSHLILNNKTKVHAVYDAIFVGIELILYHLTITSYSETLGNKKLNLY